MLRSKPLDNGGRHGSFPLALARETKVHSDKVHGAGDPWGGVEARSKILKGWEASGAFQLRGNLGLCRALGGCRAAHMAIHRARRMPAEHLGHQSASKTCTLSQKVGLEASKTRTLKHKVRQKHVPLGRQSCSKRQKRAPLRKKCFKSTYP